jgi:DNA-directed RNA polymerase subunit M/transcription elongation factor TFIIS
MAINPMLPMPPTMQIGKKPLIMPALPNPHGKRRLPPGICPRCGNYGNLLSASANDKREMWACSRCGKRWERGVKNPMLPMPPTMHIGKKPLIMPALPNPHRGCPKCSGYGTKLGESADGKKELYLCSKCGARWLHLNKIVRKRNVQTARVFDFEAPPNEHRTYEITPKQIDPINPPEYLVCPKCGKPCSALYTLARNDAEAWAFYNKEDALCGKDYAHELSGDYRIYPPMKRKE